jgi:hypothetical protein
VSSTVARWLFSLLFAAKKQPAEPARTMPAGYGMRRSALPRDLACEYGNIADLVSAAAPVAWKDAADHIVRSIDPWPKVWTATGTLLQPISKPTVCN